MISQAYIYIKPAGQVDANSVRIMFPRSFDSLKKSAQGIFRLKKEITAFFDESGNIIRLLSDIVPKSTVLVSTKPLNSKQQRSARKEKRVISDNDEGVIEPPDDEEEEIFSENEESSEIPQIRRNSSRNFELIESTTQNETDFDSVSNNPPNKKQVKSMIPVRRQSTTIQNRQNNLDAMEHQNQKQLSSEDLTTNPGFGEDEEEEEAQNITDDVSDLKSLGAEESILARNRKLITADQINDSELEMNAKTDNEEEDQKDLENQDRNDEEEEGKERLYNVIEELIGSEYQNAIENAYLSFPKKVSNFFDKCLDIEKLQDIRYINKIHNLLIKEGFIQKDENIKYDDEIKVAAQSFIDRHRNLHKYGNTYNFQSLLFGPRSCGKTTFLSRLIDRLSLELCVTGDRHHYFLFFANMRRSALTATNLAEFFKWIVSHTFLLLEAQSPFHKMWFNDLAKSFISIVETKSAAALPRRFLKECEDRELVASLQVMFSELKDMWGDQDCFPQWLANVLNFPNSIAKAFNFESAIFIIDHFETCDLIVDGGDIFQGAEKESLSDFFLRVMKFSPFIISSQESIIDDKTVEIISLCDIVVPPNVGVTVNVHFEDEGYGKIIINSGSTGGIPHFVQKWDVLMEKFDILDKANEEDDEDAVEEAMAEVVMAAETYLCIAFSIGGSSSFTVTNVVRKMSK